MFACQKDVYMRRLTQNRIKTHFFKICSPKLNSYFKVSDISFT